MRTFALALLLLSAAAAAFARSGQPGRDQILKGPLRITADETVSKQHGRLVEGRGNVNVHYDTETGDRFESFSQFALYDEVKGLGEIWGEPRALWKRAAPGQADTRLFADKIMLDLNRFQLGASGNVTVLQSSSTLKAEEVRFYSNEKKITAEGGRPLFTIAQPDQRIRISSEKIIAWTENRQIQFDKNVKGVVVFESAPEP